MVPEKKPAPARAADGATTRREQAELATRVLELAPQDPRISQLTAILDGHALRQVSSSHERMIRVGEAARRLGRSRRETRELCLRAGITGLRTGAKHIRVQGYVEADIDKLAAILNSVRREIRGRTGINDRARHRCHSSVQTETFADFEDLKWVCDGAMEYAKTARCPECGNPLLPLAGEERAENAAFRCVECEHTLPYDAMMLSVLPEASLCNYKGVPREDPDGFYRCPGCGDMGFHRAEGVCYLCGHHDSCRDDAGHEIAPEEMDEYALTGNCPDCNHIDELIAADD